MQWDIKVADALAKREHLIALGETTVYVRDDGDDFPWDRVTSVVEGGSYRLSGPCGCYLLAEQDGLTFKLNVNFEGREASGRASSQFDRERLRDVIQKLPPYARRQFGKFLAASVLPAIEQRTKEFREVMAQQWDSEDCVRGLIAFASES